VPVSTILGSAESLHSSRSMRMPLPVRCDRATVKISAVQGVSTIQGSLEFQPFFILFLFLPYEGPRGGCCSSSSKRVARTHSLFFFSPPYEGPRGGVLFKFPETLCFRALEPQRFNRNVSTATLQPQRFNRNASTATLQPQRFNRILTNPPNPTVHYTTGLQIPPPVPAPSSSPYPHPHPSPSPTQR